MCARRIVAIAVLGGLTAACTPVEWQHTAFGVAPSEAEISECNRSAYLEAQRQAFIYDFARPRFYGRPPRYAPWPRYSYGDRFFLERDLFDYCMRARGYQLVPARPAERSG